MSGDATATTTTTTTTAAGVEPTTATEGTIGTYIDMPQDCRCGLKWRNPGDSEGFLWNYQTACPAAPEDHKACWRPFFSSIINTGSGGGQAPGGAQIIINDGKVGL